ncbi:glutathione S-transferase 1-like [Anticarsia gemmatalis]|uniref:glutathione S-transferase 1-like n=1 Tax=Anticarsia gemmatalis TaxID=129554 RepID=UPI003F76DEC5
MVLTLYKLDASPPVRAVLMTIEALKIPDVEYIDVNLLEGDHLKEEYTKLNPQHTVPTLKHDDFVIWDSHAINGYLVSTFGEDDSLYPTDPKKRAIVDQRLHFDSGILFPAIRGAAEPVIFRGQKQFSEEALNKIQSAYGLADRFCTSTWIAGDEITLADICCVSTISSMDTILPIDKETFVNLWAWFQRCSEQEFYKVGNAPGLEQIRALFKSKLE